MTEHSNILHQTFDINNDINQRGSIIAKLNIPLDMQYELIRQKKERYKQSIC